ncbi:MAG: hypothetical protein RMJ28_01895 [Nitrososphaerota archaeon]|nr:hypothetical protein [Candidatus Calditenuaceae archaeon]MDW8072975.1 hypothetical protein [Nitrososphaerota archaeon]
MVDRVSVRVPASSANIGPGFDAFSVALEKPHIHLTAEKLEGEMGVVLEARGPFSRQVPLNPVQNAAARAFQSLVLERGLRCGVKIVIEAGIPVAKGLGASGAEAVGAVVAGEKLLGLSLSEEDRIRIAASAEPGFHADNVIASLLGGFNIIDSSREGLIFLNVKPPENIGLVVLVPKFEKKSTEEARKAITQTPTLSEYVQALSRASLISAALALGKVDLLLRLIPFDPFIERVRANAGLYGPGYSWERLLEEKEKLLREFEVALCISGSGPSRLLIYDSRKGLERVEQAVEYLSDRLERMAGGLETVIYTKPSPGGAEITALH